MMNSRNLLSAVFWMLLVAGIGVVFVPAESVAQPETVQIKKQVSYEQLRPNWRDCGLRPLEENIFVSERPRRAKQQKSAAEITVSYGDGFTTEAREAFERAVTTWENYIASGIEIRIQAGFKELDEQTLGGAGPNYVHFADTNGDGDTDTVFGDALVDAITGEDQSPDSGAPDIVANFNSGFDDWHFGEGDAPPGKIDFTTVVLHEIAHGLGYFSLSGYENSVGQFGADYDESGQLDEDEKPPAIYDHFLINEAADSLTNRSVFPNPSEKLGDALTSEQIYFEGPKSIKGAKLSDSPVPPLIYAPSNFESGSSISHLDQDAYPPWEGPNALMRPSVNFAETIRIPGRVICGQMRDMGWQPGPGCAFEDVSIVDVSVGEGGVTVSSDNEGTVEITWRLEKGVVNEFVIEKQYFDGPFEEVKRVESEGTGTYRVTVNDLEVGRHTFRIGYTMGGGTVVQSGKSVTVEVPAQRPEVAVYPNPFQDVAKVSFVLPQAQNVRVEVYDVLGRRVATPYNQQTPADDARPVLFDASRLPSLSSGVYFFRVRGETFSETVKAVRVL